MDRVLDWRFACVVVAVGLGCGGSLLPTGRGPSDAPTPPAEDDDDSSDLGCSPSALLLEAESPPPSCDCLSRGPNFDLRRVQTLILDEEWGEGEWFFQSSPVVVASPSGERTVVVAAFGPAGRKVLSRRLDGTGPPASDTLAGAYFTNPTTVFSDDGLIVVQAMSVDDDVLFTADEVGGERVWDLQLEGDGLRRTLTPAEHEGAFSLMTADRVLNASNGATRVSLRGCLKATLGGIENHSESAADLDGDGSAEFLTLAGVHASSGEPLLCFTEQGHTLPAQLDGLGPLDLLRVEPGSGRVRGLRLDGELLWTLDVDLLDLAGLAAGDVDGSSSTSLIMQSYGILSRVSSQGESCWWSARAHPGPIEWSSPVLADFFGDGMPEIVALSQEGVSVVDAASGVLLASISLPLQGWGLSPAIVSWFDGREAILVPVVEDGVPAIAVLQAPSGVPGGTPEGEWMTHFLQRASPGGPTRRADAFVALPRDPAPDLAIAGAELCFEEAGVATVFARVENLGREQVEGSFSLELHAASMLERDPTSGLDARDLVAGEAVASGAVALVLSPGEAQVVRLDVPRAEASLEEFTGYVSIGYSADEGEHLLSECTYKNNWLRVPALP